MRPSLHPSIHDASHSDGDGMWKTVRDVNDVPHVVPRFGRKHELTTRCWCYPVVDRDYDEPAISHNIAQ